MIILKLLTNILFIAWGLVCISTGTGDLKRDWYPKWIGMAEITVGIIECAISFIIWFV